MSATKVLVVDDEPHLKRLLKQAFRKDLKANELEFLFAENGREALNTLALNDDIDLVVSDLNMPEMNGLELLDHLNRFHPLLKTVILTAYGDMENIRAAMNRGAFDFLSKPIELNDLRITIQKTVDHVNELKVLYKERQHRYLAEKMQVLTEMLISTLNIEEVVERALQNLRKVVSYSGGIVCLKEEQRLILAASFGAGDWPNDPPLFNELEQLFNRMIDSQKPFATHNLSEYFSVALLERLGQLSSLLCLPLVSSSRIHGMVFLFRTGFDKVFGEDEIQIAHSFTKQASIAIENALLFQEVRRLATTDGLTGLFDRRHFFERGHIEVERAKRYQIPLSAIMLDIDNFKHFNDTYGHCVGDNVLKVVSGVLRRICRKTDIIGRYGGEEFAILLVETEFKAALQKAKSLCAAVAEHVMSIDEYEGLNITVSIGVASLNAKIQDLDHMLYCADRGLYSAKRSGRNQVASGLE